MSRRENQWRRSISTLYQIAEDLYKGKNEKKYYEVMELLGELGIGMLTMGDILTLVKRDTEIQAGSHNKYIFNYIMNPENKEKLMRYAESKIQYDTMENDWDCGIDELGFDDMGPLL